MHYVPAVTWPSFHFLFSTKATCTYEDKTHNLKITAHLLCFFYILYKKHQAIDHMFVNRRRLSTLMQQYLISCIYDMPNTKRLIFLYIVIKPQVLTMKKDSKIINYISYSYHLFTMKNYLFIISFLREKNSPAVPRKILFL